MVDEEAEEVIWQPRGLVAIRVMALAATFEKWGAILAMAICFVLIVLEVSDSQSAEGAVGSIVNLSVAALAIGVTGAWTFRMHSEDALPRITTDAIELVDHRLASVRPIVRIERSRILSMEVARVDGPQRALGIVISMEPGVYFRRGYRPSAYLSQEEFDELASILQSLAVAVNGKLPRAG